MNRGLYRNCLARRELHDKYPVIPQSMGTGSARINTRACVGSIVREYAVMASFDDLHDLSLTIIKSAIQHPLGLAKLTPYAGAEVPFTPKERRLLDLHHELDTLSRRIVEARESTGIAEKSTRFIFMRN